MLDKKLLEGSGINYEAGLRNFAGKENLYEKFLIKFIDDTHFEDSKEPYYNKEYEEVLTKLHALKGMSGTLGMDRLFEACSDIVSAIRADNISNIEVLFNKVEYEYNNIYKVLTKLK